MSAISIRWADANLKRYGRRIEVLNTRLPQALPRLVNEVGARARTQVVRKLAGQTGLPRKTIVKAVGDPARARPGKLSYEMVTRGGNIRLKYLAPKETLPGVVARPWGKRTLFAGTFMRGGRFPARKDVAKFGGHVWRRLGGSRRFIVQARSGMLIPVEMTTGATRAAFEATAAPLLQQRLDALLARLGI